MALTITETTLDFVKLETVEKVIFVRKGLVKGLAYNKTDEVLVVLTDGKFTFSGITAAEFELVEAMF